MQRENTILIGLAKVGGNALLETAAMKPGAVVAVVACHPLINNH